MSYSSLLINWCAVLEDTGATTDGSGHTIPDWTAVAGYEDIACRLMTTTGQEVIVGAEVVIAYYKLFLEDITITEQNRVGVWVYNSVTLAWDYVIYEIILVNLKQDGSVGHHKECYLKVVR